ncbi:MAG TPA: adenylate/guanylate cyclase domain-containing protein [Elusimicrobiota bacterium]|nr:adenylate/guanylate cyclase domain-containing protein [Elusimicrobiota bacterium]
MSVPKKTASSRFAKVFIFLYTLFFLVVYAPRFIGVDSAGAFSHLQFVWDDFLFHHAAQRLKSGDPRLILVAADDETGRKFGFPLPRAVYAQALDKLKADGARTAIFDVMFFNPREGDAELAAATRRFGRVVHLFSEAQQSTSHGMNTVTSLPVQPLLKATPYIGHPDVTDLLDEDGHMRRYALFREGVPDPLRDKFDAVSLEAAALSAFEDKSLEDIRARTGTGDHLLNFRTPATWLLHEKRDAKVKAEDAEEVDSPYRRISLLDILSGDLTDAQRRALKGSMVILASTSLGDYDHYPTPFMETAPGAEFHLNAIDNELHGDSLTSWSRLTTILLILAAMSLVYVFQLFTPAVGAALTAATLLGWLAYAFHQFSRGVIVEFLPPAAALVSAYLVLVVHRVLAETRKKDEIKGVFSSFVSPEVVEELIQDPEKMKLGGIKRDMTIFFLDIAHFTNISEKMDPEALIKFLNKYLSALSYVILKRRGTVDKYIGDCIVAFWSAPIENPNHRADAVLAALECQEVVAELNKTPDPGLPEIPAVRIGLNSGIVTVGLTGSDNAIAKKFAYTVIGDDVNLASRLEGANKFFGSRIMISESTYAGCKDRVEARTLGLIRVIGKATAIWVFEPLAEKGKLSAKWAEALPHYERGIAGYYARRYEEALGEFKKVHGILPDDAATNLWLGRCEEYTVIPPPAEWDGAFNMTAK